MSNTAGVQSCRSRGHVLEQCYFPILVFHIVALEDNSVLPTTARIAFFEFVAFDDHETEEISEVYLFPPRFGGFGHSVPLGQSGPPPYLFRLEVFPFLPVSVHGGWVFHELTTGDWSRRGEVKWTFGGSRVFITMATFSE